VIFALLDFTRYRFHLGLYSDASLYAEGWIPATSNYFSGENEPKPGYYFVLHRRQSIISWLIMYGTQSRANHAGIFVGDGLVIDALLSGVTQHRMSDYFDGRTFIITNERTLIRADLHQSQKQNSGITKDLRKINKEFQGERPHLRLFADVSLTLGALALPHLWFPWWTTISLWLIPPYLISVGFVIRNWFLH
jgi:hypothetical protein